MTSFWLAFVALTCRDSSARSLRRFFFLIALARNHINLILGSCRVEYPDGGLADISIHNRSEEEEQARRQARTLEERVKLPSFPPGDRTYIEFLGFGHFGGDAFFRDLYALADRVGAMIYAGGTVIVTKESILKEIPKDFLGMENARVVHNPAELEEAVFAS